MHENSKERRELVDGFAFLKLSARMPIKQIAGVAGVDEAEVLRLIEIAKSRRPVTNLPSSVPERLHAH